MSDIRLVSLNYCHRKDRPMEWSLTGLSLGHVNLIVGKNSAGKTRALNIISNLASQFLSGAETKFGESGYQAVFEADGRRIEYEVLVEEKRVRKEKVTIDGVLKLDRDPHLLSIYAEEMKANIKYKPSSSELTSVGRRDDLQHPFLNPLHEWASAVRHYHFGSLLGKDHVAIVVDGSAAKGVQFNDRDENNVVSIFMKGRKNLGEPYVQAVIQDMKELGYNLSKLDVSQPSNISFSPEMQLRGDPSALGFQEDGVNGMIFQDEASQGMFRALSLLVQVNYSQMANIANCILIDDIGEGLDFDRSARLIELLRNKAQRSQFQLIMTTNDRFVMNNVPLEEWSVLQRDGSSVIVKNVHNSRERFEEFKFIGMSNFSFFEMDFVNEHGLREEVLAHE